MLEGLKRAIQHEDQADIMMEATSGGVNEDLIKSAFLDAFDADVVGAENDPEVQNLVGTLPEYESHDEDMAKEIATLAESLTETQL